MSRAALWLMLVCLAACTVRPDSQPVVSSQSAPESASDFDWQKFVDQELAAGKQRIVIPPGIHRVTPSKGIHWRLTGVSDVEFIAEGAQLICTQTTTALQIENCKNITVRGLTIDYDPLPFTQGVITGMSVDKQVHDIQLLKGYPTSETVEPEKYEIFDPKSRMLRFGSYYRPSVEKLAPDRIRVTKPASFASSPAPEAVGDVIVIKSTFGAGPKRSHAIASRDSENLRMERVTVYASNLFGFYEQNCNGSVYEACRVDRRPLETDLAQRAMPRFRSLNADGFHSKHAERGPQYLRCVARYNGDDSVAINGEYHLVTQQRGATLRLLSNFGKFNVSAGEAIELLTPLGTRVSDVKAVKVTQAGKITADEETWLAGLTLYPQAKAHMFGALTNAWELTLDREVAAPPGTMLAARARMGHGFLIQDCDFGFNRSRGAAISASNGRIVGNKFSENWMHAISLMPEPYWLQSGCSDAVAIENNQFIGGQATAIHVSAEVLPRHSPITGVIHRDITIQGNRFSKCILPAIAVENTHGLLVRENTFHHATPGDSIKVTACEGAEIKGNR